MSTSSKFDTVLEEISIPQKQRIENIRLRHLVAETIKKVRKNKQLTQEELAILAGLPREAITRIESGKHNPTLETISKIASTLNQEIIIRFSDI